MNNFAKLFKASIVMTSVVYTLYKQAQVLFLCVNNIFLSSCQRVHNWWCRRVMTTNFHQTLYSSLNSCFQVFVCVDFLLDGNHDRAAAIK